MAADEVGQVSAELFVAVVVVALDRPVLDRAIHPIDLTVGPGVARSDEPVVDIVACVASSKQWARNDSPAAIASLMMEAAEATVPGGVRWVPLWVCTVRTL